ncbi:MAG: response regulator, partial [Rhodanobacteraceae bacterium]|nr:response regulator [Rhodanobacteraceae bacterium]
VDAVDPGLIVIDVDLGLRSGLVVTQELRLHGYRGAIVVFSGAADPRTRRAAERAGADAFLPKPLDLTRFHDWMKRVLPAA